MSAKNDNPDVIDVDNQLSHVPRDNAHRSIGLSLKNGTFYLGVQESDGTLSLSLIHI